jgi:hypothetical protein
VVEKKGWFFWSEKTEHKNKLAAKEYIIQEIRKATASNVTTVVLEYSEIDFLAEKLKGNV